MPRSIRSRRQTLQAQTSALLAVSCIAWLGLRGFIERRIKRKTAASASRWSVLDRLRMPNNAALKPDSPPAARTPKARHIQEQTQPTADNQDIRKNAEVDELRHQQCNDNHRAADPPQVPRQTQSTLQLASQPHEA